MEGCRKDVRIDIHVAHQLVVDVVVLLRAFGHPLLSCPPPLAFSRPRASCVLALPLGEG